MSETPIIDRLEFELCDHGDITDIVAKARELERDNARLRAALERIENNDPEENRQHADEIANRALANMEA